MLMPAFFCMTALFLITLFTAFAGGPVQHDHLHSTSAATLQVQNDEAAHVLTVRLGPIDLPKHSDHTSVSQPPPLYLKVPFDGWITAYYPRLVDKMGKQEPGRLIHHVAFYNASRPDFLCPNKLEHIFGAGSELNEWPAVPNFGYRVHPGDRIRITSMFHNPTEEGFPATFLEVFIEYRPLLGRPLQSVYPAWFDVNGCGNSEYDLPAGSSTREGAVTTRYAGMLLGVGGHMHDYGQELTLKNLTRGENVARLDSKLDAQGHILSIPVVFFMDRGGYRLQPGDKLQTSATYHNPTTNRLKDGAMGIVVGYFLPTNDVQLQALHR
jgi:hypothetical protein